MPDVQSLLSEFVKKISDSVAWHRLPKLLGLVHLMKLRDELRRGNLHDTEPSPLARRPPGEELPAGVLRQRTFDGRFNDESFPDMGAIGRMFT